LSTPSVAFLAGGGDMGSRMRAFDWSATPLGAPSQWPNSLKAAVRVMLTSRFAMWMATGPELTFFCNDAYLPTTGDKRDWVLGARSDKVWAEIWPDIGPRIERVLTTGEATWDEALLLYLERSGFAEETYHTFSYSPLDDDSGTTNGMLCVVAEVTEKIIGERQLATLRDLGSRLAASATRAEVMRAFEASFAGEARDLPFALAYVLDPATGRAQLSALHGLDAKAPLTKMHAQWPMAAVLDGSADLVAITPASLGAFSLECWQTLPRQALVLPLQGADGGKAAGFLVAGLNPHRSFDSGYHGFIELVAAQLAAAVARADEYDRERARAEALADIDRAKTVFFSNVSHEFRTPLTLMLGPLEDALAEIDTLPAAQADRVKLAHRNGLRLLRLVNGLLDFSRIEAGRVEASYQQVDLGALTAELASNFRSACERAGLTLDVTCARIAAPIYVDHDMWEKIVLNLLSNAFKFTLQGGISVDIGESGGMAVLSVRDTGTGIAESELPKLFERFHRVAGAQGRSIEGTGIGLALVHELVKLHGGTIEVESRVGLGTTFRVRLPAGTAHLPADQIGPGFTEVPVSTRTRIFVDEALRWLPGTNRPGQDDVAANHAGPAPSSPPAEGGRILLADDNADLRDYVGGLLRTCGYAVETVADGRAALLAARAHRPDLVLTDVMMPELDGFGLLAAIRADEALADLPVVILSARAGEEAQVEGLASGADDYLAKPFSARELLARVRANMQLTQFRRKAIQSIADSEMRFRAAVQAVEGILWTNNAAGEMQGEQPGWAGLTGQTHDAYQGYGWSAAVHPDDTQATIDAWNEAVADRKPFVFEHRVRRHDGAWRIFSVRAIPMMAGDGTIREWVGVHTDITQRRTAEAEQARLAAVVEQSSDFIGFASLDGRAFFVNEAGRQLVGLTGPEGVDGTRVLDYVLPELRPKLTELVLPAVKRDGNWTGELALRHLGTGAAIPALHSVFLVRDRAGAPIGLGMVTRDLTEQKRTEAALRASEARLKAIFETVPVGIVIAEAPSGRIVDGNRQAEAILGHPILFSPDIESYAAWVSYHADGRLVLPQEYPLARAIAGEQRPELEACYQRGDGRQTWVRFIGAPIRAPDGRITGGIVASLDIDRETRALQALDRTREELEVRVEEAVRDREVAQARLAHAQRMEALGQLAGGIAHDFNNVLQAVSGGLRLIQRRAEDPDAIRKIARMVMDAADRGASVTARLLTFARKGELRAVAVPTSGLLETLREILASTLGANITIRIDSASENLALQADKAQLETVLVNLAVNARDAMPEGGTLTLAAQWETVADAATHQAGLKPGAYVRLVLSDTGIGMDAATLARATEPFFTTKGPGQGTGLGLAMARGFAQQSGGALVIASTLGGGTEVTLWFPEASAADGHAETSGIAAAPETLARPARVLVVDDDPMVLEMLARELEALGFETVEASDGLSALARLDRGEKIDLLITDLSMPGMNGALLTREARQRRAALPVMLLTGYADASLTVDLEIMPNEGVVLLRKPVIGRELARHATELLMAKAEAAD
jgi:PAS domain S-box-containing protein